MKSEYLIFNIIVLSGPLIFGAMRSFYFLDRIKFTILPILIPAVLFLIWDSIVTKSHWQFNPEYVLGITIFNLPIEEILFFITVPFACLFTWEMIIRRTDEKEYKWINKARPYFYVFIPVGILFFISGKHYTGLATAFLGFAILIDKLLKTNLIVQRRFYFYLILVVLFTLIFNGYLTWRPVVTYGVEYQLDFRIFTIPIEDFIYGTALIFMNTSIYQKIINKKVLAEYPETKTTAANKKVFNYSK
ncbi:MAG: lycopene cyclase domain-containing protein [Ignavibacteriaceae bacterium]|nr:lycopene cyclase domain-containing protein [Ignavibacteriaceae bacterium]